MFLLVQPIARYSCCLIEFCRQYRYILRVTTRIKITFWDIVLIAFLAVVAAIWFVVIFMQAQPGMVVEIHNADGLFAEESLDEDATITVPGPLGDSILKIENGSVYMFWSPCPNKMCMHRGAIRYAGESIVCVPNRVYVVIRDGERHIDAVAQ